MIDKFFILVSSAILCCAGAMAQRTDTLAELKNVIVSLKKMEQNSYKYTQSVQFSDGQHDQLDGRIYINTHKVYYFNECNAFTMLYTKDWFYRADHRKKAVTVIDLNRQYDKKLKTATEKDIFKNVAIATFLDSVVMKTAIIKKMERNNGVLDLSLGFPNSSEVSYLNLVLDEQKNMLQRYEMAVKKVWQRTPKGLQVIETKITCTDFSDADDGTRYDERELFSHSGNKIDLKKYKNYKLITKM